MVNSDAPAPPSPHTEKIEEREYKSASLFSKNIDETVILQMNDFSLFSFAAVGESRSLDASSRHISIIDQGSNHISASETSSSHGATSEINTLEID